MSLLNQIQQDVLFVNQQSQPRSTQENLEKSWLNQSRFLNNSMAVWMEIHIIYSYIARYGLRIWLLSNQFKVGITTI